MDTGEVVVTPAAPPTFAIVSLGSVVAVGTALIERRSLPREIRAVSTCFGEARVKVALADGRMPRAIPEYEDSVDHESGS